MLASGMFAQVSCCGQIYLTIHQANSYLKEEMLKPICEIMNQIKMHPIGIIRSPYLETKDIPIQGRFKNNVEAFVELNDKYVKGLKDLDKFSHAILLYYFHKSDEENISCFFNVLCGYFIQDVSEMDKEFLTLDHYFAWKKIVLEYENLKYKTDFEKYDKLVVKYKLTEPDLKEAFEHGIDLFHENLPIIPGFSMFYEPVLDFNTLLKQSEIF